MLPPWYVTGFCDGEAAFTYSKAGGAFNLYFSLRQRENGREIVEKIREFFSYAGNIYRSKAEILDVEKENPERQSAIYYRVTKIDELKYIIGHFDKYPLQSRKHNAYLVWRKMVVHKTENYRNTNYDLLKTLSAELANLNQKSRASKAAKK